MDGDAESQESDRSGGKVPLSAYERRQYRRIDRLSSTALSLLDTIWHYGMDRKFNDVIEELVSQLYLHPRFADPCSKLATYQTIFSIDIDRDLQSGAIAHMMHSHVVDTWRLVLLQISLEAQRLINQYLWIEKRRLGLYVEQLQRSFAHKNQERREQSAIIRMLGQMIGGRKSQKNVSIDHEYEMVMPRPYSMFGYWFRS